MGTERAGWEQLIERMGAELCKSLKKRVTTHLVCKQVSEGRPRRAGRQAGRGRVGSRRWVFVSVKTRFLLSAYFPPL